MAFNKARRLLHRRRGCNAFRLRVIECASRNVYCRQTIRKTVIRKFRQVSAARYVKLLRRVNRFCFRREIVKIKYTRAHIHQTQMHIYDTYVSSAFVRRGSRCFITRDTLSYITFICTDAYLFSFLCVVERRRYNRFKGGMAIEVIKLFLFFPFYNCSMFYFLSAFFM